MKNRIINGIGIAFHSIGFYASAAVIIRMLIAIVMVNKNGAYIRYDATFGDEYSALLMFLTGFYMYRKHTGLCATVNLSPSKRVITAAISAIFLSAILALFDIAMVKEYFSVIKGKTVMLSWEKLFYSITRSFTGVLSENSFLFLLKLTLIYHLFFYYGLFVKKYHFYKAKPYDNVGTHMDIYRSFFRHCICGTRFFFKKFFCGAFYDANNAAALIGRIHNGFTCYFRILYGAFLYV